MKKAIQQFQLRNHLHSMEQARQTLQRVKQAGYTGIELNGFMMRPLSLPIRMLCQMSGMGIGKSDRLDWDLLLQESELEVVAIHEDLSHILTNPKAVISDATRFHTKNIVFTGKRKYDYTSMSSVLTLAEQCNQAGELLQQQGLEFFYHNHNCEFQRMENQQVAYDYLLEQTNPEVVSVEFDSFWASEAGIDVLAMMDKIGLRLKLYHVTDRGIRPKGPTGSIVKSDCMELGLGNAPIEKWITKAVSLNVEAVIVESHRNWIHNSAIESLEISGKYLQQLEKEWSQ